MTPETDPVTRKHRALRFLLSMKQYSSWKSMWLQVGPQFTGNCMAFHGNTGHRCLHKPKLDWTKDLDMALDRGTGPNILQPQVSVQAAHISLIFTTVAFSVLFFSLLSNCSTSPSFSFLHHIPGYHSGMHLSGPLGMWQARGSFHMLWHFRSIFLTSLESHFSLIVENRKHFTF